MGFAGRLALLCALGLATLGASPSDQNFARFLDRMRSAGGPAWDAHLVSVSRLTLDGRPTVVSSDSQGLRIVVRRCVGELCQGTYFDGLRLYAVNMNDTALPQSTQPEPYLRALRLVASSAFLAPAFTTHGGRADDGGFVSIGARRYRTVVVADHDAIALRLYVDPQTGLIRYARDLGGADTFEYRDYRHVGGMTLPFEVLHDGQVLERYDDRAPVTSSFHPPHGLSPAFAGPADPIPTDPKSVTPIVTCSVAGISLRCLLDSGNSGLSMSSELASRLGAPVVGGYRVQGLGGYATQVVRAGPLRLGNATFPEAYYFVLSDLRRYGYDIVLGADILGATSVEIDPAAHVLRLAASPAPNAITIPLAFQNFVPVVDVQLGTLYARLAVDTGDESNINLAYDFYAKHPGLFAATQRRLVSGIGGSSVELIGEIPQVTIGSYHTGPQRIGTTQSLQGTAFGHLGAAFLQQFRVQLDYAAAQLHLVPQH